MKVNRSLCHIIGYTENELLNLNFQKITYPDDLETDMNYLHRLIAGDIQTYQMEKRYIHKNGEIIWVLLSVSMLRAANNKPLYFISQIQNIDTQKKVEFELKDIAYHDVLTKLGNRKKLELSFEISRAHADRHQHKMALLFMDLDLFKKINDAHGHNTGDRVLITVATRLPRCVSASDFTVRLGGDEFIILLTEVTSIEDAYKISQTILAAISKPIIIDKHIFTITASIGISLYPNDGRDLEALLKNSDSALYKAKKTAGNSYQHYIPEM